IVSAHLIIALGISIRLLRLSRRELGLCRGNLALQLLLMGGGLGLGAVEYTILKPTPLITTFSWSALLLLVPSLMIFTGFTEEVIFRGLLQAVAPPALGSWALVYVSLLFAAMHIGYRSVVEFAFVFGVGL